jgi:hypothetical protein
MCLVIHATVDPETRQKSANFSKRRLSTTLLEPGFWPKGMLFVEALTDNLRIIGTHLVFFLMATLLSGFAQGIARSFCILLFCIMLATVHFQFQNHAQPTAANSEE